MTATLFAGVSTTTIGEDVDALWSLREEIKARDDELKELKTVFDAKRAALMDRLQREGINAARGRKGSVSLSEPIIVANVENWDEVWAYIHRNKAYHLVERRIANAAYREILANRRGKDIPGIKPFEKVNLNLRTV